MGYHSESYTSKKTIAYAVIVIVVITVPVFLYLSGLYETVPTTTTTDTTTDTTTIDTTTTTVPVIPDSKEIAIVFATGGLGDKSFNDACYAGVVQAQAEFGWNFDYVEPTLISNYEGFLQGFAAHEGQDTAYDLIISIGYDQAEALNVTASAYPDQRFAIVDMVVYSPNVTSIVFEAAEGSALVGAIAGMTTMSDKIGFIGGMDIPLINEYAAGYFWGANYTNQDVETSIAYTNDWVDTSVGQTIADVMYDDGVDVIFGAAGRSGLGIFTSAKINNGTTGYDNPLWAIGVDNPQMYIGCDDPENPEAPTIGLTSMLKRIDVAIYETIKQVYEGTFDGGIDVYTLTNGGVDYEINEDLLTLPAAVITAVEDLKALIIAGEVTVPTTL
ncbi:MAG: BMP family lipoprotein [Candidatus Thorarchaeota archaeon]